MYEEVCHMHLLTLPEVTSLLDPAKSSLGNVLTSRDVCAFTQHQLPKPQASRLRCCSPHTIYALTCCTFAYIQSTVSQAHKCTAETVVLLRFELKDETGIWSVDLVGACPAKYNLASLVNVSLQTQLRWMVIGRTVDLIEMLFNPYCTPQVLYCSLNKTCLT